MKMPGLEIKPFQTRFFREPEKNLAELFSHISSTYELINHLITFGLDNYWRRQASKIASFYHGSIWLDMCTGSGEMAQELARYSGNNVMILGIDFCWAMLSKLKKKKLLIFPLLAQAQHLPLKSDSVDLITLAFATRNLFSTPENLHKCWQEFYRVLKPGGLYLNLETSQPPNPVLRRAFHFYVSTIVKVAGQFVSGNKAAYSYLSDSILHFPDAEDLKAQLLRAGFSRVKVLYLSGGLVALHLAIKAIDLP